MSETRGKYHGYNLFIKVFVHIWLMICSSNDLWIKTEAAGLEGKTSYVGVVGSNLTLTWTFTYTTIPINIAFLITTDPSKLVKTWTLDWSKPFYKKEKIPIKHGSQEYIFNNITDVKYNIQSAKSSVTFYYMISSVPRNVTKYYFSCRVKEDKFSDFSKTARIQLADAPTVNFTIAKNVDHVKRGDEVQMQCTSTGFPLPLVQLQRKVDSKMISVGQSLQNLTLSISNVQPSHAGMYFCSASNIAGKVKQSASITVTYIDKNGPASKSIESKLKDKVELRCLINGFPKPSYAWFKDNKRLTEISNKLQVQLGDKSQFGKYECKGMNSAGKECTSYSVIEVFIKLLTAEFVIQSKNGEKRNLDCPIHGSPKVVISWFKNNKKIADSKMLALTLDKKDKFGNYTCVGKNKVGTHTAVFSLKESSKTTTKIVAGKRGNSSWQPKLSLTLTLFAIIISCLLRNDL